MRRKTCLFTIVGLEIFQKSSPPKIPYMHEVRQEAERAGRLQGKACRDRTRRLVTLPFATLQAHRIRCPNIRSILFANHVPVALAVQHTLLQLCRRIGYGSVLRQADQPVCIQNVIRLRLRLLSWQSSSVLVRSQGCKEDQFDTLLR